jgi:glycogen operon protein
MLSVRVPISAQQEPGLHTGAADNFQGRYIHQFVRKLISHRLRLLSAGHEENFGLSLNQLLRRAEIDWQGIQLGRPDWSASSHSFALTVRPRQRQIPLWLHVMFNAY